MKAIWLALLLTLALPLAALAQEGGAAEETPAPAAETADNTQYSKFTSPDFGFSLMLPHSGVISKPGDQDWGEDKQIAFNWYGAEADPVALIQGRVDTFEADLDEDTFKQFCEELAKNWTRDAEKFKVLTDMPQVDFGGRKWNLLEIEDNANAEGKVFYSVFSTYAGKDIYTITMYYLRPVDEKVQNFGKPVLQGFSL